MRVNRDGVVNTILVWLERGCYATPGCRTSVVSQLTMRSALIALDYVRTNFFLLQQTGGLKLVCL